MTECTIGIQTTRQKFCEGKLTQNKLTSFLSHNVVLEVEISTRFGLFNKEKLANTV